MNKLIHKVKRWLDKIGPGFVTGAADDDPSGIATYSIAGARFGYRMSWMTLFLIPAMISIQEMCGRIGMVTGRGLAQVIKDYHSRQLMWLVISLLGVANIINIGADLGIIASSLQMLLGWPFFVWLAISAMVIIWLEIAVPYRRYSGFLKWMGMSLLVYVVTAFLVKQDWAEILKMTVVPHVELSMGYLMTMVGFAGTTISPYLFFWQASEEVEERIIKNQVKDFDEKPATSLTEIRAMRFDTNAGMIFSSLMAFFIMITSAATLHRYGILDIETPQQAALALKPLAGEFAYLLFAVGMIGIGLQAIPILAGSLAYAVADGLGIKMGLSKKFSQAKGFYLVILIATLVGALMNLLGVNTMQALYYAAIVNGVAAVPLIYLIIKMADDHRVVDGFKTDKKNRVIAWLTFGFMALSVVLMIIFSFWQ